MMASRTAGFVERADTGEITETIIALLADANGEDALDIEQRLYDILDPDALDRIFRDTDGQWRGAKAGRIEFSMCGCHVLVRDTGHVVVTPRESSTARY